MREPTKAVLVLYMDEDAIGVFETEEDLQSYVDELDSALWNGHRFDAIEVPMYELPAQFNPDVFGSC